MFWGKKRKKYNKKKIKIKDKKEKKQKKKRQKTGKKNIVAGKALLQSTMLYVGSYSAFTTPFTIHIVFLKKSIQELVMVCLS